MAANTHHDPSLDYARYPTLAPISRPFLRCSHCGSTNFGFLLPALKPMCKGCGHEPALMVAKPGARISAPRPQCPRLRIPIVQSDEHIVILRPDGTVKARGKNDDGRCNTETWADITSVAAGAYHTVGLRSDGTVDAIGDNSYNQCDVEGWDDITAIAAGWVHTVGLRSDGTVLAVGKNDCNHCDVSNWADIIAVAAGNCHTVGLRSDGTVLAVGTNIDGQRNVEDWTDVTDIWAGGDCTAALRRDGTLLCTDPEKLKWLRGVLG